MENTTAFIQITAILSDYFDGIYEGNTEKLDRVFHPEGKLSCVTDGYLNLLNKTEYLEIVANREPPERERVLIAMTKSSLLIWLGQRQH